MKFKTFLASLAAVTGAVAACDRYLDIPVARACQQLFRNNRLWARWTADIPDLLLLAVSLITAASAFLYLYRLQRRIFNRFTWFCLHTACAVPVSYALKSGLKLLFGRVNTRYWLVHPEAYRFNWFHSTASSSGFPSGHMAVYAALSAGIWRCYPTYGPFAALGGLLLGGALIVTNYHFLGDVIAGAFVGVCVEAFTAHVLERGRQTKDGKGRTTQN